MTKWKVINGSKIEESYFDENVAEAKRLNWVLVKNKKEFEHQHCLICNKTISTSTDSTFMKSEQLFIDTFCYERFVK